MNLFQRAANFLRGKAAMTLSPADSSRGWTTIIRESFAGAWQQNVTVNEESVMAQATVFACMTLIASDIAKCRLSLTERRSDGIWEDTEVSPSFYGVLFKPNKYQTRQRFIESWVLSLLSNGNTYALKQRDERGIVIALYILEPKRVETLVADNGDVYYRLQSDTLSGISEGQGGVVVPASEMIHDRINCMFHPLVGLSPIFACGLAATQALKIQNNSALFFENMSKPGGLLSAPAHIADDTAKRLKDYFEENYSGKNIGRIAVLGDGLTYEVMTINPVDAQMVEQLKMSSEQVCSTFHVPAYMVGAAAAPAYNNVEALNQQYYSQCLQALIESIETNLDDGLDLAYSKRTLRTEFDLDDLLRMDQATMADALVKSVGGGVRAPNEARKKLNLKPLVGGDTVYLQQQQFSMAALYERDQNKPFDKPVAPAPSAPAKTEEPDQSDDIAKAIMKRFAEGAIQYA